MVTLTRRRFLARCGAIGAFVVVGPLVRGASVLASPPGLPLPLRRLVLDTFNGVVAFTIPGNDPYSRAQGVTTLGPGGADPRTRAAEGMAELFDRFLPWPDSAVHSMTAAVADATSPVAHPTIDALAELGAAQAADDELRAVLATAGSVPLSLLVALAINFLATSVSPAATAGAFPAAPFANLSFADKAETFRRLEEDHAELLAALDGGAPEPVRATLSGHIELVGGLLPAVAFIYSFNEYGVFDCTTGTVSARPLGWDLASYAPGRDTPPDGWDDFKGYYRGRRIAGRHGDTDA